MSQPLRLEPRDVGFSARPLDADGSFLGCDTGRGDAAGDRHVGHCALLRIGIEAGWAMVIKPNVVESAAVAIRPGQFECVGRDVKICDLPRTVAEGQE